MIRSMFDKRIILAMANLRPKIMPEDIKEVRSDVIIAIGFSDYPNQVNNVLYLTFTFRGALDVGTCKINEEMKVSAIYAIVNLASAMQIGEADEYLAFGSNYILPNRLVNVYSLMLRLLSLKRLLTLLLQVDLLNL